MVNRLMRSFVHIAQGLRKKTRPMWLVELLDLPRKAKPQDMGVAEVRAPAPMDEDPVETTPPPPPPTHNLPTCYTYSLFIEEQL